MFIKTLELVGFKSFAEKTKLKFADGMTCVVGPNGCGKSNIGEAIRWVFGEQSAKKLRGSRMDDFIFNGTNKRKPLNRAEVAVVLDNEQGLLPSDYNEVEIKRRVFTDGQSEYYINNQLCRLKDVRSLITDTGIGISAYSFIEQGMISEILSKEPTERRKIFEEAAGVMKYRMRKKETLKKLDDTKENVDRLKDIIFEVERQINSLERQVEKVKKYKEKEKELKYYELIYKKVKYNNLNDEIEILEKKVNEIKDKITDYVSKKSKLKSKYENLKLDLIDKEEELKNIESKIYDKKLEMGENKSSIERLEDRINYLKKENQNLKDEKEQLKKQNINLNETVENKSNKLKKQKMEREGLEDRILEIEQEIDEKNIRLKNLDRDYQSKVNSLLEYMKKKSKLNTAINNIKSEIKNDRNRKAKLKDKNIKLKEECQKIEKGLENIKKNIENYRNIERDKKNELKNNKIKLDDLNKKIENKSNIYEEKRDLKKEISAKLESIEMFERKMEGLNRGSKEIIKNKKSFSIKGILADFVEVKDGYEKILENILSDFIQILISEKSDFEKIKKHISKRSNGEKIIYFDNKVFSQTKVHQDSIYKLCDIKNKSVDKLLKYLLGDVILRKKQDEKALGKGYTVVLKDGTIYYPSGIVIYSDLQNQGLGVIERKSLKKNFEKKLDKLNEKLSTLKSEIDKFEKDKMIIEKSIKEDKNIIYQNEKKLDELISRKKYKKNDLKDNLEEIEINKSEIKIIKKDITEYRKNLEEKINNLDDLVSEQGDYELKKDEIQSKIDEIKNELSDQNKYYNKQKDIMSEKRNKINSLKKDIEHLNNNIEKNKNNIKTNIKKINENSSTVKKSQNKIDEIKKEINSLIKKIDILEDEKIKKEEKIKGLKNKVDKVDKEIDEINEKHNKLQNNLRNKEIKFTEKKDEINVLFDEILNKYGLSIKKSIPYDIPEKLDKSKFKEKVDVLKNSIKSLGNINMDAVNEYNELKERYEFLLSQKEDLDESKEKLEEALDKIETISEEKFIETFYKIKKNFKNLFPKLFNGGKADIALIMEEDEDVLNAGIDVNVKPPGKRLQNINLLSGGEKALSAIALLFSIFKVKPAPFCVLDEIDAPLDDTNVSRFINLLSDYTDTTQFIIITHNKYTIESADSLYGVTMDEPGVSKLVSVSLKELERTI